SLRGLRMPVPGRGAIRLEASAGIASGEWIALTGPSGSGKSTLLETLAGLRPHEGELLFGARPLCDWPAAALRRQVLLIPQRPWLAPGSIADNLRLVRADANREMLARALAAAGLDELVARLPQGLDTPLGARGHGVSGGQAHRIALARMFLSDAPVLLLDEPTAHLDDASRDRLMAQIAAFARGKTLMLATHDPAVAAMAGRQWRIDAAGGVRPGGRGWRGGGRCSLRAHRDPDRGGARSGGRRAGRPAVADRRRRRGASMRALLAWMWPMFRQRWRALRPACALALVTAAAAVGLLGVSGWFLTATALVSGALAMFNLFVPSAMVRGLAFTRILSRYGERVAGHAATLQLLADLRTRVFGDLLRLDAGQLARWRDGDLVARLTGDIDALDSVFLLSLLPLLAGVLIGTAVVAVIAVHVAVVGLLWLCVLLLAPAWLARRVRRSGAERQQQAAALRQQVLQAVDGHADLLALDATGRAEAELADSSDRLREAALSESRAFATGQ